MRLTLLIFAALIWLGDMSAAHAGALPGPWAPGPYSPTHERDRSYLRADFQRDLDALYMERVTIVEAWQFNEWIEGTTTSCGSVVTGDGPSIWIIQKADDGSYYKKRDASRYEFQGAGCDRTGYATVVAFRLP